MNPVPLSIAPQASHVPLTLLVDRDPDTRRMYAEYLRLSPCNVDEAEDGREALAKAIALHPDIIVTETRLPGISGFELCSLLRSDHTTRDVPIVFVTADSFEKELEQAQLAGADSVLIKPCLPETLLVEIRHLLTTSAELRERARQATARVRAEVARSERLLARSTEVQKRLTLSRAHVREQTTAPATPPPDLVCPSCDRPLTYTRSHIGGVNARASEQWDYYECSAGCGAFQYRQRTRKVRRVL